MLPSCRGRGGGHEGEVREGLGLGEQGQEGIQVQRGLAWWVRGGPAQRRVWPEGVRSIMMMTTWNMTQKLDEDQPLEIKHPLESFRSRTKSRDLYTPGLKSPWKLKIRTPQIFIFGIYNDKLEMFAWVSSCSECVSPYTCLSGTYTNTRTKKQEPGLSPGFPSRCY